MSRSINDIQKSLVSTYETIDPSIDVSKGPAYDIVIRPFSSEAANIESKVENLTTLYSRVWNKTATDNEIISFARNFGLYQGDGGKSKGYIYFMRYTRPKAGQIITIPLGYNVTNSDNTLAYQTSVQAVMHGDYADSYFNSVRGTYEIRVPAQAASAGSNYDLSAYRITVLSSSLIGIDGVENRSAFVGGSNAETVEHLGERTIKKFMGLDSGVPNGIESNVVNYDTSNVSDVSIVYPKDRSLFTRRVTTPAMDVYVIGEDAQSEEYIFTSVGGEKTIAIEYVPVISVDSVQVNDQDVDFTFLPDTSSETKKSARAVDTVVLSNALVVNDVISITYTYNKLIYGLQQDLFSGKRSFNTDILARSALGAYITFQANVKIASSFDIVSKQTEIENKVIEIVQSNKFEESYIPSAVRDEIMSSVTGILEFIITKFTRTLNGKLNVETISFNANETPMLDDATFDISVRQ
jgi:uncharacterized phage protein gp47/JayE